jgi:hypothetical protein
MCRRSQLAAVIKPMKLRMSAAVDPRLWATSGSREEGVSEKERRR